MKMQQWVTLLLFVAVFDNAAAYGGSSSSKKACKQPKFSRFSPPHLATIRPQGEFSFIASANTLPDSIQVSVKNEPVTISVSEAKPQYLVTGQLPASVQGSHARINIKATAAGRCKGSGGWLLKLAED